MGEKWEGSSSNMYKGHMDKAKEVKIKDGRWGWVGGAGKMETTVLEQQQEQQKKNSNAELFNGYRVPILQDGKVLESDYTTM